MNADFILILVALTNLRLMGMSRLGAAIRTVAAQGILLGSLPIFIHGLGAPWHTWGMALGSAVIKGWIFPWLLLRALRQADVRREVEPYVGFIASLFAAVTAVGISLWVGQSLMVSKLPGMAASSLLVPVAAFSLLVGFFLIVARKKAVNQVLGFLVLENGVYTFGVGLVREASFLVELGVLLDVFVAVFVMGIMIFHINREFDHMDTDRLSTLKD